MRRRTSHSWLASGRHLSSVALLLIAGAAGAQSGCSAQAESGPPEQPSACTGSSLFCDDFTDDALANAYTTQRGTWTRGNGMYGVTHNVAWERARALLAGDYADFDVTLTGRSRGDAGFGLSYAAQAIDDGLAVIIHPAQFQGVYLKRLVPGQQDVDVDTYPLPTTDAGKLMTLRVRRVGTAITVWLDGTEILARDDGGTDRHGKLGLLLSMTDETTASGAEFSLLRLDSATAPAPCTPECSGKACGPDGCGGSCGSCDDGKSCDEASGTCSDGRPSIGDVDAKGRTLVWAEEFDGPEIDRSLWGNETGMLRNHELQCYTTSSSNQFIDGGELVIRGIAQSACGGSYTSASLITQGKQSFQYGRLEARIRVPGAKGSWPAFWLLPTSGASWPAGGEIDVMEVVSQTPRVLYGTAHYQQNGQHGSSGSSVTLANAVSADYHVFAIEWTSTQIDWYVDDTHYHSFDTTQSFDGLHPFQGSFYVILNLAIGGDWPEAPDAAQYPADLRVDWVRYWK